MTLLSEIQAAATDSATSVGVVLRKCLILSARLHHDDLRVWADRELNGYPAIAEEYPPYRVVQGQSFGNFAGPFGSALRNAPIPHTCLPEEVRSRFTRVCLREPVSTYESLLAANEGNSLQMPWPADLLPIIGTEIYEDMNCLQAWLQVPNGALIGLLENVRNRVLSLALQIESSFPDAGEVESTSMPSKSALGQVFNTYIMGSVQNWATGSSISQVSVTSQIQQSDFPSLAEYLASIEVPPEDVEALKAAVQSDSSPSEEGRFGPKVSNWFGGMLAKAAQGGWKITTEAATKLLTEAILSYYGLK